MKKSLRLKALLTLLVGLFLSIGAFAQQIAVKGHVKDTTGEPVIGANVLVKGTTNGTITDFDGNFMLNVPKDAILSVSFVGYKSAEVKAASTVMVTLEDDSQVLDAVVVIGYGSVKKNDMTGSVTAMNRMWGVVTPAEAKAKIEQQRAEAGITEPKNLEEQAISLVGTDIYEKLIKGYTGKQWGRPCTELPAFSHY